MHNWLTLASALAEPARRTDSARRIAAAAGAEDLLLLVRDPLLGVLLPATGMPQTLRAGAGWRSFMARCGSPGRYEALVDLPPGSERRAVALCSEDAALVLLGGTPEPSALDGLVEALPLISSLLSAEQRAEAALADARVARDAAVDAGALARALESARADSTRLVARLREDHERKDEFLAMLAHELRNPLAPITMAAAVLRHPDTRAESQGRLLDTITRQVGQMSRLIEDLLDVSRVNRGRIELRLERVDLREVARAAIETVEPLVSARRHQLSVLMPEGPLVVEGDFARLSQIVSNLLTNAAKYTDCGGRIALSLRGLGDRTTVEVSDNGVGIPTTMLERVFDLFMQAPAALDRAHGGLGIGLTLVRKLVELHGGQVVAESPGPGCGSTFRVMLPLARSQANSRDNAIVARAQASTPSALRILVVDDNRDAADSLSEMLRLRGHAAIAAYGAADALAEVEKTAPQLVFLDLGLPGIDGYELATMLRERLPSVRLIALTGYGSEDDRARTKAARFDEHQVKPLSEDELEQVIRRAVEASAIVAAPLR